MEKKIILPLGWNCPIHNDAILDEMIKEHTESCTLLAKVGNKPRFVTCL